MREVVSVHCRENVIFYFKKGDRTSLSVFSHLVRKKGKFCLSVSVCVWWADGGSGVGVCLCFDSVKIFFSILVRYDG